VVGSSVHPLRSNSASSSLSGVATPLVPQSRFVKFNVKGRVFTVLRDTLLSIDGGEESNFFSVMLSGRIGTLLDADGNYFIDRNPDYFDAVLDIIQMQEYFCPGMADRLVSSALISRTRIKLNSTRNV
jgi:hypothetical protein